MNNRQLEAAREIRLWITHIIFPIAIITGALALSPNVRSEIFGRIFAGDRR